MPGKVRVKIIAGRNLPVMDRSNDTADAFVEIKLANITYKTDVYRKSLNPQWNTDFYRFELDDAELQDEPLQIRLMDHDTYTANDAIGKVSISLNPLLLPNLSTSGQTIVSEKGAVMAGWIPVFDTMHGIRGEVNIVVKVDLFSDVNKFRQSSCGVKFFHSPNIPHGYHAQMIHGFVEELVVNDDPEYQWIDKIRTPRASNDARQLVFLRLSGQVQRKIGLKAIDLGANAVIGYTQCFDLEGDVGVVARGIGTAVTLERNLQTQQSTELGISEEIDKLTAGLASITAAPVGGSVPAKSMPIASAMKKDHGHVRAESSGCKISQQQSPAKTTSNHMTSSMGTASTAYKEKESVCRRSSDSDLSVTPKANSFNETRNLTQIYNTRSSNKVKMRQLNQDNIDMLEYPFLTLSKYPKGFIMHIGATVCARSVKLLERVPNPDEPETRDSWWTELRMEIRSHARALGCNVILGYSEITSISDDVCVLSVTGTAAVINLLFTSGEIGLLNTTLSKGSIGETDRNDADGSLKKNNNSPPKSHGTTTGKVSSNSKPSKIVEVENGGELSAKKSTENVNDCSICHIPYSRTSVPFNEHMKKCLVCKNDIVPDVLLATIEIPDTIEITGHGCFLQAQVCRTKKDLKSESNAKEISDCLPFLEYDLHRLLINKLKSKGMNAIFGLRSSVTIGEKVVALIATGTAVFLKALPAPTLPKIIAGNSWTNTDKLNELQKSLQETVDRNREIYQLKSKTELECTESSDESDDESIAKNNEINLNTNNKGTFVLEVDDVEDLDIITMLMEPSPPEGFHVVNTHSVPGMQHLEVARNLQMFTQIWRAKLSCNQQGNINLAKHFQRLLQTIFFKLRTMIPCAICDLRFRLELPDTDEIQLLVTGMALGLSKPKPAECKPIESAHDDAGDELMFRLEEESETESKHHSADLSTKGRGASFNDGPCEKYSVRNQFPHSGSLKLNAAGRPHRVAGLVTSLTPVRERYGVELTPLSYVPGGSIRKYLGNLNFFFIRESTSIRESGGVSGFVHSFITEMLAVVRAHVTALGGNALISFYMTELALVDNPHKNQGQCLISVGGDVVFVSYFTGGE